MNFNFTSVDFDQMSEAIASMPPYCAFGDALFYNHKVPVLRFYYPCIDGNDSKVKYYSKAYVTEQTVAMLLECTLNRVHQAAIRCPQVKCLRVARLDNLSNPKNILEGYCRVFYQGRTYTPLGAVYMVISQLSKQRPYLPVAQAIANKGYVFNIDSI